MKYLIFKSSLAIHLIINIIFLVWYFYFDGFLGYGYGELLYVLFICIITLTSSLFLIYFKKIKDFIYIIEIILIIYNIWLFNLLCHIPKNNLNF